MVSTELPSDLHEDILFRVPPRSLVRFKSVCKKWNNLVNSKRFGPEIMVKTHSHVYSISVDLNDDATIKVSDLCFPLSFRRYHINDGICDGYFFMVDFEEGCLVWNPLLGHIKLIAKDDEICGREMGYDGRNPQKNYKIITIHDYTSRVFLNGNVYWTGYNYPETGEYFIEMLDFSKERTKIFCKLPCEGKKSCFPYSCPFGLQGRSVFSVTRPDFPLVLDEYMYTSYFVEDNIYGKSFVLCCRRKKPRRVWVYIVRGDLCKKIKIDGGASKFRSYVYIPSLITIS